MDNMHLSDHISQQFNSELEDIRNRVLAMGGLVEKHLAESVAALVAGDSEKALQVAADDVRVNTAEVSIDEDCNRILARRQPTATDLRLVVAVIKTITDLERIGDEAKKVANMASSLASQDRPSNNYREVEHLAEQVKTMLRAALDCYARMDVEAALKVVHQDKDIDRDYESVMRQLMTFMMEDPRSIKRVIDVMWCVRSLERIGDHAANIAEYVIYFVEGKDVRHINPDEIASKIGLE